MASSNKIDWTSMSTFTVSRGYTYSYKYLPSSTRPSTPVLLFLHGWPSGPQDWDTLASSLHSDGYGCLIPSCLGYLETSTPEDPEAYNSEGMAGDMHEILLHENIESIIAIGHDWGSFLAQRMAVWYPQETKGLVTICVQYMGPDLVSKDLEGFIAKCKDDYEIDYENFAYVDKSLLPTFCDVRFRISSCPKPTFTDQERMLVLVTSGGMCLTNVKRR